MPGPPKRCSTPATTRSRVRCGPPCAACAKRPTCRASWPKMSAAEHFSPVTVKSATRLTERWRSLESGCPKRLPGWVTVVAVEGVSGLTIASSALGSCAVLTPHGLLDSSTYLSLRDRIIKAALEEPEAVIIDVADLCVPAESAWAVFTSARWHVDIWPEVPIMLVCAHLAGRSAIA